MKNFPLSSFARYRFNGITRCRPVVWANFVSFVGLTLYFRKAPVLKRIIRVDSICFGRLRYTKSSVVLIVFVVSCLKGWIG